MRLLSVPEETELEGFGTMLELLRLWETLLNVLSSLALS